MAEPDDQTDAVSGTSETAVLDPTVDEAVGDTIGQGVGQTMTDAGSSARVPIVRAGRGLIGKRLAHFRISKLLGRGGMGEVYLATDEALERPVAVKVLSGQISGDDRLRERFFREARAQARIQHPNVCHIYYIGEEDGLLFFVMEYIDGESVAERLARMGTIPPGEAVEICRMAALGLREAQRQGFSHRDVKPSNLMIDENGAVKVVDFGLVKETGTSVGAQAQLTGDVDKTAIVGTPLYMAPEQARGDAVDLRSDVYALGATLHHLVSGAPPFVADTPMQIVSLHSSEARPRIAAKKRRGPAPIDALCDRMMAKEPDGRFASYDDLVAAMENVSPSRTRAAGFLVRLFAILIDIALVRLALIPVDLMELPHASTALYGLVLFLYFVIGHARYGRTLGKAALEIEVVSNERHEPPGLRSAALRFLVEWGPIYVLVGAEDVLRFAGTGEVPNLVLGIITVVVMLVLYPLEGALSSWLVPNKRTIWDRVAGTRVRYRRLSAPAQAR